MNPNNPFVVAFDFWKDVWNGDVPGTSNVQRIANDAATAVQNAGGSPKDIATTYQQVLNTYNGAIASAATAPSSSFPVWVWVVLGLMILYVIYDELK